MKKIVANTTNSNNASSTNKTKSPGGATAQQKEQIQAFLNWIDRIEIRERQSTRSKGRSSSFINGPYADIKELIGKISSPDVEFRGMECQ